ncbi:DUF397 domain-containing protein [Streptomyces zingiberis]|nr:DUF397 domain-containing protein [Streptomyces zingiberis]
MLIWRKSSYSGSGGGQCVEVAAASGVTYVRDSVRTGGPVVRVPATGWAAFVEFAARR